MRLLALQAARQLQEVPFLEVLCEISFTSRSLAIDSYLQFLAAHPFQEARLGHQERLHTQEAGHIGLKRLD